MKVLAHLLTFGIAREIYILNDRNFEHDTQATTGSTTGDWFVLFCPTLAQCDDWMPKWGEARDKLYGLASVAIVDL